MAVHPIPPLHYYKVIEIVEIFELASCMAENVKSSNGYQLEVVEAVLVLDKVLSSSRRRQLIFVCLRCLWISDVVSSSGSKICVLTRV